MLYLKRKNEQVDNEAMLNRLNIKWEHEKLARFGHGDAGEWDDASYTEERFVHWGSGREGYDELRAIVAQWRIHIELGKMAAKVLCEYIDSRIHCFDNTQKTHPSLRKEPVSRDMMTDLAEWQANKLAPVLEKYTVSVTHMCTHVCVSDVRQYLVHGNTDAPFANKSAAEVRGICRARPTCANICIHARAAGHLVEREAFELVYQRNMDTSLVHECSTKYCQSKKRVARAAAPDDVCATLCIAPTSSPRQCGLHRRQVHDEEAVRARGGWVYSDSPRARGVRRGPPRAAHHVSVQLAMDPANVQGARLQEGRRGRDSRHGYAPVQDMSKE